MSKIVLAVLFLMMTGTSHGAASTQEAGSIKAHLLVTTVTNSGELDTELVPMETMRACKKEKSRISKDKTLNFSTGKLGIEWIGKCIESSK